MMGARKRLTRGASYLAGRWDTLRLRLKDRLGAVDPIQVLPYRSFGSSHRLRAWGRVLEEEGIQPPCPEDTWLDNLKSTWRRIESNSVPGARLIARYVHGGEELSQVVETSASGYYDLTFETRGPVDPEHRWHAVNMELLGPLREDQGPVRAASEVLVPPAQAAYAVISDVDDTIMYSGVTSMVRHVRMVLFNNAHTRKPFPGVGALYRAFEQGPPGSPVHQPIFYLSSSPWNFYDLIMGFIELQNMPPGPLILRELDFRPSRVLKGAHTNHKLGQLRELCELYPDLPLILVGDTGQHDAGIYAQLAAENPERVLAIYLRQVERSPNRRRTDRAAQLVRERSPSTAFLATEDSLEAAEHAASRGWIAPHAVAEVRGECERETA